MTSAAPTGAKTEAAAAASFTKTGKSRLRPSYWPFVLPALITVGAVIVFPWVFTLWMSANQWQLGGEQSFVGFDNYLRLAATCASGNPCGIRLSIRFCRSWPR
jgi:multiple sugar transport system permease protein